MCNYISNAKILFLYFILFFIINFTTSKSIKKFEHCEQFYLIKDCYYFPCLDTHYLCGRDSHLVRFSYDLCLLTRNKYASRLAKNAQLYFNHTNICAMSLLHEQLIEKQITNKFTCTHLQQMVFKIYLECFQNKERENKLVKVIDFCSIICENLQVMIDLFLNVSDMFINLHELLIETGSTCGAMISQSIQHTIPSLLTAICLDRKNVKLEQDITNIMFNQRYEHNDYEWN